jgi:hypothetical protein
MNQVGESHSGPGRVLLDTSIQIERHKIPRKSNPVETAVREYPWTATSSYARLEFKRAWVKPLALVYVKSKEHENLPDLQEAVREAYPKARNRQDTILQAVNAYLAQLPGKTQLLNAVPRLRAHLEIAIVGFPDWWRQSVNHEFGGTDCVRAIEDARVIAHGQIDAKVAQCRPGKVNCGICRFFDANRGFFTLIAERIESGLDGASADLRRFAEIIRQAQKDSSILQDDRVCAALADCIIAVDGIDTDSFAAHNPAEWSTIADAFGKRLLDPVVAAKQASQRG